MGVPVAIAVILQPALAGLIADGAVERMVEQQVFERLGLRGLHLVAVGDDDRAVLDRRLAAGDELGTHGDRAVGLFLARLDQAHAATGDHGERGMPAVARHFDTGAVGHLNHVQALVRVDLDRSAVYEDGPHQFLMR